MAQASCAPAFFQPLFSNHDAGAAMGGLWLPHGSHFGNDAALDHPENHVWLVTPSAKAPGGSMLPVK